jgi:hypothetical protein
VHESLESDPHNSTAQCAFNTIAITCATHQYNKGPMTQGVVRSST